MTWYDHAACRGSNNNTSFSIERPPNDDWAEPAKAICATCDVRAQCLAFALDHRERDGVWGGTTPAERRRLIRERGAA
jgi:WhiB family redox-sensing transcriptional regulator